GSRRSRRRSAAPTRPRGGNRGSPRGSATAGRCARRWEPSCVASIHRSGSASARVEQVLVVGHVTLQLRSLGERLGGARARDLWERGDRLLALVPHDVAGPAVHDEALVAPPACTREVLGEGLLVFLAGGFGGVLL